VPAAAKPSAVAAPSVDVERLAARAKGFEYEVPVYKYESIFKPQEDLLEKKPEAASAKVGAKVGAKKALPSTNKLQLPSSRN
jgi:hypothetical protein